MDNNQQVHVKKKSKWWIICLVIIVVLIVIVAASGGDEESASNSNDGAQATQNQESNNNNNTITYETVDLQKMLDDLDSNAMKAEQTYQNKYVQVTGKIYNFDSDGAYISIEPVNADEWNFDTVMCYIKNDAQKQYLLNKSKGDTVTIKGKVTSIGEVLGYSIDIKEVS